MMPPGWDGGRLDRNMIPDSLTIYLFVPQELRDNYPVDGTPDLVDRARITSMRATHREGQDYSRYLDAVRNLAPSGTSGKTGTETFAFSLPDGRVVTSLSQFTEPHAADLMRDYLEAKREFDARNDALMKLREAYGKGDRSLAGEIKSEENQLEQFRGRLRSMANGVVKAETGN